MRTKRRGMARAAVAIVAGGMPIALLVAASLTRLEAPVGRWRYFLAARYDPRFESHSFFEDDYSDGPTWTREETIAGLTFYFGRVKQGDELPRLSPFH